MHIPLGHEVASNNKAKALALQLGIKLALAQGIRNIDVVGDSMVIIQHMDCNMHPKKPTLQDHRKGSINGSIFLFCQLFSCPQKKKMDLQISEQIGLVYFTMAPQSKGGGDGPYHPTLSSITHFRIIEELINEDKWHVRIHMHFPYSTKSSLCILGVILQMGSIINKVHELLSPSHVG